MKNLAPKCAPFFRCDAETILGVDHVRNHLPDCILIIQPVEPDKKTKASGVY
jgi:hypothetical protein